MAKSVAKRQKTYRKRITDTHQRIELILPLEAYNQLAELVKASGCKSRIDYVTSLISRGHAALQGDKPLLDNVIKLKPELPSNEKQQSPIILWDTENKCCQAQTAKGKQCRVKHNLLVIPYCHEGQDYEVLTCKQHREHFKPYVGLFQSKGLIVTR